MSRSVGIGTIEQDDGDGHLKRQIVGGEVVVAATDVSRIVPTREQMSGVLEKLRGADRRSIGRAAELIADVLNDPTLFGVVFNGILSDDPIVRMRLADVVEKITAEHPEYLQSHKTVLVEKVADIEHRRYVGTLRR